MEDGRIIEILTATNRHHGVQIRFDTLPVPSMLFVIGAQGENRTHITHPCKGRWPPKARPGRCYYFVIVT